MQEVTEAAPGPSSELGAPRTLDAMPAHVAIIMDGNGRWAGEMSLPRSEGHRAGTENIRRVLECFRQYGVKYLTLFTFSTENWTRPESEVKALMELLREVIRDETRRLHEKGVRLRHIGRMDRLSPELQEAIREGVELTKDNTDITVNVAFDYGGRAEIIDAVRAIVADGLSPDAVTEDVFERHLYTSGTPDPDLIIRTAGEMRLSNFLLWQAAYAEYYSTSVLWPDFGEEEIAKALAAYSRRQRRYGRVSQEDVT
jgi:undecaprenyl diphosphate synthase